MSLLIFFALVFATIILAIVLQRIIHCPILVGFAFFSIFLLVAVILSNTTFVIISIILGIIAFLSAFFDCVFSLSGFLNNNNCLNVNSSDSNNINTLDLNSNNTNSSCGCSRGVYRRR